MTFREKLKQEHPECVIGDDCVECPDHYGYETYRYCPTHTCKECWDREISEVRQDED